MSRCLWGLSPAYGRFQVVHKSLDEAARGLKAGEAPTDVILDKRLWFISQDDPRARESQSEAVAWARANGVTFTPVLATTVRDGTGGKLNIIGPSDAKGLYVSAHRALTAVITYGTIRVPLDPTNAPTRKSAIQVGEYVANKAFSRLVTRPEETSCALQAASDWMGRTHCTGREDPRCLPRMMFPSSLPAALEDPDVRQRFKRAHHSKGASWRDKAGRDWDCGAPHTLDALHVGGECLPLGMHWDVSSRSRFELANGWEKWVIPRSGYINVHPDGFLRGARANRVWKSPCAANKR